MNKLSISFFILLFASIGCKKEVLSKINFKDTEPPKNLFLANSPWPITHCNSYAQASSSYQGPEYVNSTKRQFLEGSPGLISLVISSPYSNGKRVIWGGNGTDVMKLTEEGNKWVVLDKKRKEEVIIQDVISVEAATSGAYTLIDKDNIFYTPRFNKIYAYGDEIQGDMYSKISLLRTFQIPENFAEEEERIVGLNMTYDGWLVFATNNGLVGVVDRSFTTSYFLKLQQEEISNSIACDEDNGIYIVTSAYMHRVQWTGNELSQDPEKGGWTALYETGEDVSGIRLGKGSGSTPTLIGFGNQDKFVAITDGQDLMHIVFFWRDKIPNDWEQISGTLSKRIAAQEPITFGNPNTQKSLSEQSLCVSGFDALVVNNQLKNSTQNQLQNILSSGNPENAPYGAEMFSWNSKTRKLTTKWVNKEVSLPSGIPCMSASSNLAYCMGQRNGIWNFTALNWHTGTIQFEIPFSNHLKFNSAYAATEIGLNKSLYSGTLLGACAAWE